jgi:hypothetical protein
MHFPEISSHSYSDLIFNKGAKKHILGENRDSSANGVGNLDIHM